MLIAECSLYLTEHLQKGGSLRHIAGRDIDEISGQRPALDRESPTRTVAFKLDGIVEAVDSQAQTGLLGAKNENQGAGGQSSTRWFDTIEEFEISLHASLIGYTVQCLMAVSKWESLVDISNRLNNSTTNEFASQLLPFIIYA